MISDSSSQPEDQVERAFLLNVVVRDSPSVLQALSGEDESLLIGWDAFLVPNLLLNALDAVSGLCLNCDGLSGQSAHENLHSTPESKDQVERAFLLNVIVSQAAFVLELLASKDESLLVCGDAFLVPDELLEVRHGVSRLHLACHCPSSECLHEYLHLFNDGFLYPRLFN
jgi:hypothetical protein